MLNRARSAVLGRSCSSASDKRVAKHAVALLVAVRQDQVDRAADQHRGQRRPRLLILEHGQRLLDQRPGVVDLAREHLCDAKLGERLGAGDRIGPGDVGRAEAIQQLADLVGATLVPQHAGKCDRGRTAERGAAALVERDRLTQPFLGGLLVAAHPQRTPGLLQQPGPLQVAVGELRRVLEVALGLGTERQRRRRPARGRQRLTRRGA